MHLLQFVSFNRSSSLVFSKSEPLFQSSDFLRGPKERLGKVLVAVEDFLELFLFLGVVHEALVIEIVIDQAPEDERILHVDFFVRVRAVTFVWGRFRNFLLRDQRFITARLVPGIPGDLRDFTIVRTFK